MHETAPSPSLSGHLHQFNLLVATMLGFKSIVECAGLHDRPLARITKPTFYVD